MNIPAIDLTNGRWSNQKLHANEMQPKFTTQNGMYNQKCKYQSIKCDTQYTLAMLHSFKFK